MTNDMCGINDNNRIRYNALSVLRTSMGLSEGAMHGAITSLIHIDITGDIHAATMGDIHAAIT